MRLRSRIIVCAFWGSFQKSALSESAFSSASRFSATPQSKTPPQQPNGLLDCLDHVFEFGRHCVLKLAGQREALADMGSAPFRG
jgi:hypothetical protein